MNQPYDPGPVPEVVEPDGPMTAAVTRRATTIHISDETAIQVGRYRESGQVWLTVRYGGTAVTASLEPEHVDVLLDALALASPGVDLPDLPDVDVYRGDPGTREHALGEIVRRAQQAIRDSWRVTR